jgi:hypothetical protein
MGTCYGDEDVKPGYNSAALWETRLCYSPLHDDFRLGLVRTLNRIGGNSVTAIEKTRLNIGCKLTRLGGFAFE